MMEAWQSTESSMLRQVAPVGWGNSGCPLLPREVREYYKGIELPQKLALALGRPLTVDQLDRDISRCSGYR